MSVTITLTAADGTIKQIALADPVVNVPASGEPDASMTGAKGALTNYTGPFTVSAADTVIQNKIINQLIRVTANNVTFKNCRITGSGWGIDADGAANLVVSHCTITGSGNSCVLTGRNSKIEYCDLSGFDNGLMVQDGSSLIQFNYIHDLHPGSVGEAHVDGIQISGPCDGVTIKANSVRSWDTSCVFMKCDWGGDIKNVVVDGNWLRNQSGKKTASTCYAYSNKGYIYSITFSNNMMEKGQWYYLAYNLPRDPGQVTWTNNKDIITGAVIPKP